MNIEKAPKYFCDNITVGFSHDFFAIGLASGEQVTAYALTPSHAKRLAQYLAHRIDEFEQQHGAIVAEPWTPEIKSPLQITEVQA